MAHNPRIEDLRRRVQKDPASIAFAQLAEELRRSGQLQEAVDVCRAGLTIHPSYLSARVTLGRALIDLDQLDEAESELRLVLKSAPDNLAAIRGLGEIHHRRGSLADALAQFRAALLLAPKDPDLQQTVDDLSRKVEPHKAAVEPKDGLSFADVQGEFFKHALPPAPLPVATPAPPSVVPLAPPPIVPPALAQSVSLPPPAVDAVPASVDWEEPLQETAAVPESFDSQREHALRQIAALEQWIDAIHVARTERSA